MSGRNNRWSYFPAARVHIFASDLANVSGGWHKLPQIVHSHGWILRLLFFFGFLQWKRVQLEQRGLFVSGLKLKAGGSEHTKTIRNIVFVFKCQRVFHKVIWNFCELVYIKAHYRYYRLNKNITNSVISVKYFFLSIS